MGNRLKRSLKYIVCIILLVLAIMALNLFFSSRTVVTYDNPLSNVIVSPATVMDLEESATFPTYIQSDTMVPVVPFVSGTIESYPVKAGDRVEKDQILATIDRTAYELQLSQAEAALAAYTGSYSRLVRLQELGAATEQDTENLKAQMDAASAQRDLAALQLSYTDVKSPIDGTVIIADQAVGDIASTQAPVAVIADTDNLVVEIAVPERWYTVFTQSGNLEITVSSDTTGASSSTTVISMAPYIDPTSKTFTLKAKIDDPSQFTIGMYAKATVSYRSHDNVATVDESALKADGTLYYVEAGVAHALDASGQVHASGRVIVPQGYEDRLFVTDGHNNILDGERVNAIERGV